MPKRLKVANVVGARPNFMKIAPIMRALEADPFFDAVLVHTGQHYDIKMSDVFFEDLGLAAPNVNLAVGSGPHGRQTGQVMMRFEEFVENARPDVIIVVGDVNSTLAAALVAAKLHIPVAHVEAGLRSFDRAMPEEINRVLTDAISDFLFITERSAEKNLVAEGIPASRIYFVGNVMIDALLANRKRAEASDVLDRLRLEAHKFAVLTLHRPSNVDDREALGRIVEALKVVGGMMPIIFPAHPRTIKNLEGFGLLDGLEKGGRVRITQPLGYIDFLRLTDTAAMVLTDSGGLQEETTVLGVPCITLRENTERPVTVEQGTNVLVGNDTARIIAAAKEAVKSGRRTARIPEHWDGRAADRIVAILKDHFSKT